jgi:hypothetical protein
MQQARPPAVIAGQAGITLVLGDDDDATIAVLFDHGAQGSRDRDAAFAVNRGQRMTSE